MKFKKRSLALVFVIFLAACSTTSNIKGSDYVGVYENPKNSLNRFVIDYKNELYRIKYYDTDLEWEGVGYEVDGRIIAVFQPLEEEGEGRFLNISFPGNNQLFVVSRNLEGGYLSDEYFQKIN